MLAKTNKTKISVLIATLAIVILGGGAALAWGPERQTYTVEKPADKVTFNSITNNPNHGDERNFTLARRVDEGADKWRDNLEVTGDSEYVVRIYVHNNAASNLNLVARNARAAVSIPSQLSNSVTVQGQISADNASPKQIWDQVVFKSASKKFNIAYIAGSARYYTNANPSAGFQISDSVSSNAGAQLGYDKIDGNIPGCFQYSGILTFRVKVTTQKTSSFNATKQVRKLGETEWKKSISAKPGDTIEYMIGYDNNGEVEHTNVNVRDILPSGITYVQNSTFLKNGSYPNGNNVANNDITTRGVSIGGYKPGANAFIKITAKIASEKDLKCGVNTLTNVVRISTPNGAKENTATVTVNRNCTPQEKEFCQIIGKTHLKKDDPKCKEEKCEIPGKSNLKKDDPNCKNDDKCAVPGKESLKPNDPNCFEPCEIKGKENLKKNDPNCAQIPSELPQTGPAEAAIMIIAVVAISGAVAYYVRSRQELKTVAAEASQKGIKEKMISKVKEIKSKISKK